MKNLLISPTLAADLGLATRSLPKTSASSSLHREEVWEMDNGTRGLRLRVLEGVLWVTQTGDPTDHVIGVGEVFETSRSGRVVAESLTSRARLVWNAAKGV